jgi:hypothetical protein
MKELEKPVTNYLDKVTANIITRVYIRDIQLFSQSLPERVLPNFNTLEVEAEQLGETLYKNSQNQYDAEAAYEKSRAWFYSMSKIRQSLINLYSVGLRHLFEQQIYDLTYVARIDQPFQRNSANNKDKRSITEKEKLRYADFEHDKKLLKEIGGLDIETLAGWTEITELMCVSNAIKHAEGRSMAEQRNNYPGLLKYSDPSHDIDPEISALLAPRKNNRAIKNPLAGDDIYLKEQDIKRYADAIERFWLDFVIHINK